MDFSNTALIGLLGIALTAAIAIVSAEINRKSQQELEQRKIEASRVLDMLKDPDPVKVQRNLYFLMATGLLSDPDLTKNIKSYYETTDPTVGPAFPQVRQIP